MKKFKLNGKEYEAKEFDFNLICDLEDMGISLDAAAEKTMNLIRAYISFVLEKEKNMPEKKSRNIL